MRIETSVCNFFFFFILGIITNWHSMNHLWHLVLFVAIRYEKVLESICLIKLQSGQVHRSWGSLLLNLRDILTILMKLIVNMLGSSSSLSIYFWLNSLILFVTYGTLRLWYNVLLMTYQKFMIILFVLKSFILYIYIIIYIW